MVQQVYKVKFGLLGVLFFFFPATAAVFGNTAQAESSFIAR